MPLGTWPDVTDDDATGTSGTPVDKAWADAVRDSVEDAIFSSANPTISPGETTDEVVDARGVFNSLSTRLDDLQSTVGSSNVDTSTLAASDNVAYNPDLAAWGNGSTEAPDHFVLSGTGAAVEQVAGMGAGPFSARLTYGSAPALLTSDILSINDWADQDSLGGEGRILSLTVKVQASIADQARIVISDGVTTTESAFHSGSGDPENLTVSHTISGSATKLSFYFEVAQSGSADFTGIVATYSDTPAPSYQPPPRQGRRIIDINTTDVDNNFPNTILMAYTLAPNILRANGVMIHVVACGFTANNDASKVVNLVFGSFQLQIFTGTTSTRDKVWTIDAYIVRVTASSQLVFRTGGLVTHDNTATEDETTELELYIEGVAAGNNDIVQQFMMVEVIEPSAGI